MPSNITISLEDGEKFDRTMAFTIFQMVYGIPTIVLMTYFLFLFGLSNKYFNSFYRILQLDLLINIFCWLNTWFSIRFEIHVFFVPILKWVEASVPGFLSFSKHLDFWFMHMQFLSALSICLHRWLSMTLYGKYNKIDTGCYFFWAVFLFIISAALTTTMPGAFNEVFLKNGVLVITIYEGNLKTFLKLTGWFSAAYFLILLAVGLGLAYFISWKLKRTSTTTKNQEKEVRRKLTRICATYCFVYMGILLWSIVGALNSHFEIVAPLATDVNFILLGFSSDMMTLSLPWILLVFDVNVRRDVFPKKSPVILVQHFGAA